MSVLQPMKTSPAARKEVKHQIHGDVRADEFYWLRERDNPEVRQFLEMQNARTDVAMHDTEDLQEALYQEIRGRMPEDDVSAPVLDNGYFYYYRYFPGAEYPVYYRRKDRPHAERSEVLDVRVLEEEHDFLDVRGLDISPDNKWLLYAKDTVGRRLYSLFARNLESGEHHDLGIHGVAADPHWANTSRHFFVTEKDPETLRECRTLRFEISGGELIAGPDVIYEEHDTAFAIEMGRSKRWDYLFITAGSTVSTEYRLLDANQPLASPVLFCEREPDHEYYLDYDGDTFFLLSNFAAPNFELLKTCAPGNAREDWTQLVAHRPDCYLEDFELTCGFIVIELKQDGLTRLEVIDRASQERHRIEFEQPVYSAGLNDNCTYDTALIRYGFESLATPDSVYEYDLRKRTHVCIHQDEVGGDFDTRHYRTERIRVAASDGEQIPVSLVWHVDTPIDGSAPLVQYGYGAYGYSLEAGFSYSRLSLLDRGFVYAIAHVRGGAELGRQWYESGRLDKKMNSFTDFISVTEALSAARWANPERIYASGGSAGGLLVGAVMNLRPDLYHGVIADVPFVDVLTTMLDESLPLTTGEYDEWGDPRNVSAYADMRQYSPYDNIADTDYPHVLVLAGWHDSQVQYWEPAKWAARLQKSNTASTEILLYTNLDAGHGGASGRYEPIRETALTYAFLLRCAEVNE